MGNEASSTADADGDDYPDEFAKFDGIETLGYRVLGVQPNSPASAAGLVSFLDFLVGCNGKILLGSGEGLEEGDEYNDLDFPEVLRASVGKELELLVHNIKSQSERLVNITPSSTWGGAGLLGVTIRLDDYGGADERLIRVLSVEHNSPASIAGLVPMTDYLLGTTSASFDSDDALASVLMVHADRVVEMYVYSSESDVVRVVTLMPTLAWGGRGLLGAEVGMGYLHRFPKACRGTDGRSVERRIRMGARPTDVPPTNEAQAREGIGMGVDVKNVPSASEGTAAGAAEDGAKDGGQPLPPKVGQDQGPEEGEETVDLTALTDAMAGTAMHFEAQMEMESGPSPSPPSEGGGSTENNEQKEQNDIDHVVSRPKETQHARPDALPATFGNGHAGGAVLMPPSSSVVPPSGGVGNGGSVPRLTDEAETRFAFPPSRSGILSPPAKPPHIPPPPNTPVTPFRATTTVGSVSGLPPPPIRSVLDREIDLR